MSRMKEEDFKKLLLIAATIENLQDLGFHRGKSAAVLENLYSEYEAYIKRMSLADILAFTQYERDKNV